MSPFYNRRQPISQTYVTVYTSYFLSLTEAVRLANQNVGETISVSKPLVMKKPVILPKPSLTGATITLSKDKPGMRVYVYVIL